MKFSDIKVIKDETIDEQPLPEYTPWVQIVGRPTSLSDLNLRDAEALAEAEEAIEGLGDMAYEDAVEKAKLGATIIEGGYLKTGFVDASRIDTGTLNAARVSIGSDSNFDPGYDPSTKLETDDVGDLAFEDLVEKAKLGSTIIDGGYIKSSLLTADNIITGTLTGLIIQTATSGLRVRMSSSPTNKIEFLDGNTAYGYLEITDEGSGQYDLELGGSGGALKISSSLGTANVISASMPWFSGSGNASSGKVIMEGSPNYGTEVGLYWSGGGTATWSFDLGDNFVKMGSDIDMNDYDVKGVDDLYVKDIYGNGVSEIDIYEDIDMNNHDLFNVEDLVVDGLSVFNSGVAFQTSAIVAFLTSFIKMGSLPTSDPGVAGVLWRSGNNVKVSTG